MPVLGLAGRHWRNWKLVQVHGGDQSPLPPLWNSFVGTGIHNGPVPPANLMLKQEKREQPKEVLHLCRWSTHTHSALAPGAHMESASPQPAKASRAWGSQLCHDIYWEQLAASASYPPTHQLKPGHDHLPPGLGVVEFLLRPCDLFLGRMGADGI